MKSVDVKAGQLRLWIRETPETNRLYIVLPTAGRDLHGVLLNNPTEYLIWDDATVRYDLLLEDP